MGVQIGFLDTKLVIVISCEIVLEVSSDGAEAFAEVVSMPLSAPALSTGFANRCLDWRDAQSSADPMQSDKQTLAYLSSQQLAALVAFVMPATPFVPTAPASPSYIYGNQPFARATATGVKFLQYEPWSTSRRLNEASETVFAGTYVGSISERPLVLNGFAAVGRYALPNLLPACTVWEIEPPSGTRVAVGIGAPLRAGWSGAEVCFQSSQTAMIFKLSSLPVL